MDKGGSRCQLLENKERPGRSGESGQAPWKRRFSNRAIYWGSIAASLLKMSLSYVAFCVLKKTLKAALLRSQKSDPGLWYSWPQIIKNLSLVGLTRPIGFLEITLKNLRRDESEGPKAQIDHWRGSRKHFSPRLQGCLMG